MYMGMSRSLKRSDTNATENNRRQNSAFDAK